MNTPKKRMHRILERQMKKANASLTQPPTPENWGLFIENLEKYFSELDDGRSLLERSLSISAREMREATDRQKEISIQLAQSSKLASLGTLASGIAHELNNPLAGILGHAEVLLAVDKLEKNAQDRVERIINLSNRMAGIIKHLLKLSRKPTESNHGSVAISQVIDEVMQLSHTQFTYENIDLVIGLGEEPLFANADIHSLMSVFQNLLNNSHDEFMRIRRPDGRQPKLVVRYEVSKSDPLNFIVSLTDNAGGIQPDVINRIFDPFFTTKEVGEGTGLGLTLCKKILQEIGGKIWVESSGVNTTFFIQLKRASPVLIEDEKSSPRIELVQPTSLTAGRPNILIVDDEKDILEILKHRLGSIFEVTITDSPVEAVQLLNKKSFDYLLTDLKMPTLSGDALVSVARGKSPNIGCCVISGHAQAVNSLASDPAFSRVVFIEKPIPAQERLIALIYESAKIAKASTAVA